MKHLKSDEMNLLVEVLKKRQPSLLAPSDNVNTEGLTRSQIEDICQLLTDEFCETGLQPNSEPNRRGLKLEDLIDRLRSDVNKPPSLRQ